MIVESFQLPQRVGALPAQPFGPGLCGRNISFHPSSSAFQNFHDVVVVVLSVVIDAFVWEEFGSERKTLKQFNTEINLKLEKKSKQLGIRLGGLKETLFNNLL